MHSLKQLEDQFREQQSVVEALERVVSDSENVTLQLGFEIREQLDEVVERMDRDPIVSALNPTIRV